MDQADAKTIYKGDDCATVQLQRSVEDLEIIYTLYEVVTAKVRSPEGMLDTIISTIGVK